MINQELERIQQVAKDAGADQVAEFLGQMREALENKWREIPAEIMDMHAEVARELALRKAVYPGLIEKEKLTRHQATKQYALLRGVLPLLELFLPGEVFCDQVKVRRKPNGGS